MQLSEVPVAPQLAGCPYLARKVCFCVSQELKLTLQRRLGGLGLNGSFQLKPLQRSDSAPPLVDEVGSPIGTPVKANARADGAFFTHAPLGLSETELVTIPTKAGSERRAPCDMKALNVS